MKASDLKVGDVYRTKGGKAIKRVVRISRRRRSVFIDYEHRVADDKCRAGWRWYRDSPIAGCKLDVAKVVELVVDEPPKRGRPTELGPGSRVYSVRVSAPTAAELDAFAKGADMPVSDLLRAILDDWTARPSRLT